MAKETKELEPKEVTQIKKKSTAKKATTKKASTTKKATTAKKASTAKKATTVKKASATKKDSAKDASTTKKASAKKTSTAKKATTTKKVSSAKKTTTAKKASTATKKTSNKKSSSTVPKNTTEKKSSVAKKVTAVKKTSTVKKDTPEKKATTVKKASTEKKNTPKKSTTTKKSSTTSKKTASKTTSTRKRASTKGIKAVEASFKSEYYDLPYMYNNTVVKVLAQTPKMLFIYWEISEEDRNNLENTYGQNFFEITRPVLIVYNDTMHYSFEVDINDFANSWYLHIEDANCDYHVELGRRPYPYNFPSNNSEPVYIPYYIYLSSSNKMTSPNNKILFDPSLKTVRFKNVKTGQIIDKDISQFTFITNFGIFKIRDLYEFLFPGESFEYENIVLGHTSSGALSSSGMFSSQFK